jgi:hypothetical protein
MAGYITVDRDSLATVFDLACETDDVDSEERAALSHIAHSLDAHFVIGDEQRHTDYFDRFVIRYGRQNA